MNKKLIFRLYANCIPVKGARRSVVCDLQRGKVVFITNDLHDILKDHPESSFKELINTFGEGNEPILLEYFSYLEANDLGLWCTKSEIKHFPPLDLSFEHPYPIDNVIIDIDENSHHPFKKIFSEIEEISFSDIQIRTYSILSLFEIDSILSLCKHKRIKSISLLIQYSPDMTEKSIIEFIRKNLLLDQLIITSAPEEHILENDYCDVIFTTQKVDSDQCCGIVSSQYFSPNIHHFTEATAFNTCLNRKIGIDTAGRIKNCPSQTEDYGNVQDMPLTEALRNKEFTKYWKLKKNDITTCKDCEFRYICTDCRVFRESEDLYAKPSKCSYDPYTCTWQ
ncbi:MAG: grasp-with-spasm system SPASM domain peptide maturase [Cyclobacteriaceae bacterium]